MPKETIPLEQDLEQLETQLREVNANQEQLNKNFLELTEVWFIRDAWTHLSRRLIQLKHVLRKTQAFFEEAQNFAAAAPGAVVDAETGEEERIRLLNRVNGLFKKVF